MRLLDTTPEVRDRPVMSATIWTSPPMLNLKAVHGLDSGNVIYYWILGYAFAIHLH